MGLDNHRILFSWYDHILFYTMLGVSALIGIYFGCFGTKQSTAGEYLLGSKSMKVLPVVISLVSSHVSGITLLGVPAEVYSFGSSYWLIALSLLLVAFTVHFVYLPVFFKLQVTSTYEYLELRFDRRVRSFGSLIFALSLFFYLPIVIYIPALAFSAATGVEVYIITPIICGVCIFYTTIGGLKAVVWTDTLQFTITLAAATAIFVFGTSSAGGLGNVFRKAYEGDRLNVFDFDPNPFKRDSFWTQIFGTTAHWMSITAAHQACVQKFLSVPTLAKAKVTTWLYALGIGILNTLSVCTGLIMYAKYSNCDPFMTAAIKRKDELLPYYVMDVAGGIPGLPGLFIAGIVCAALSTLSAMLNCLSGAVYEDFISKMMSKHTTDQSSSYILKLVVVIAGVICTALVFVVQKLGGIFQLAVAFTSVTAGPALGLFTLGMLFPRANAKGALFGGVTALVLMTWWILSAQYYKYLGIIQFQTQHLSTKDCIGELFNSSTTFTPKTNSTVCSENEPVALLKVSHYYYTFIGATLTIAIGYAVSCITKEDKVTNRDLFSPVIHRFIPNYTTKRASNPDYCNIEKALQVSTFGSNE